MIEKIKDNIFRKEIFYSRSLINDIFSWNELEKLLNLRPFVNNQRFHDVKNKEYTWDIQYWLSDINSVPPFILNQIIVENPCYLSDCSRVNSKVNSLCRQIEQLTRCPTDAHIYFDLKGAGSESFGIHSDNSHNLIVQIEGVTNFKVWNILSTAADNLSLKGLSLDAKPYIDVVLVPGDVLYIPKHFYHQAISLTQRLSISFPHVESDVPYQDRHWIKLNPITT